MSEIVYKKLDEDALYAEFEKEKENWNSLPRKDSFSGLAVSDRLNRIQQEMSRRDYDFEAVYMKINMGY